MLNRTYSLSQKVGGIGTIHSEDRPTQHGKKPMFRSVTSSQDADINTDEWARIEVRFADTTNFPFTKYLSMAGVSLVLRLAEHPEIPLDLPPQLHFPIQAAHIAAADMSLTANITPDEDVYTTALGIQEAYLGAFEKLDEKINLPSSEKEALPYLRLVIDALHRVQQKKDDIGSISHLVEWAARYSYLTKKIDGPISVYNDEAVALSLLWDRVPYGYGTNFAKKSKTQQGPNNCLSTDEIEHYLHDTPTHTRARLRGILISDPWKMPVQLNWLKSEYFDLAKNKRFRQVWNNPYTYKYSSVKPKALEQ